MQISLSLALTQPRGVASGDGLVDATAIPPGASWNGTAESGYSVVPADAARTGPKAIGRFLVPQRQRFASDFEIIIDAECWGGVSHVDLKVEGSTARVTSPAAHAYTDVNQNTVSPFGGTLAKRGYRFVLDHSAFIAQHGSGNTIHVYATIVPSDSAIQERTIGPLILYPESTAHDYEVTVAPSGADYTSIQAAIDAMRTASALCPKITITQSGFYELVDGTGTHYTSLKGRCVITHANGVTATLGRASLNNSDVDWNPKIDNIEFRGSGIVIDQKNFGIIEVSSATTGLGHWANGIKITNSLGTSDTLYWNKGPRPRGVFSSSATYGGQAASYITDSVLEWVNSPLVGLSLAINNRIHEPIERFVNGTVYASDNYVDSISVNYYRESKNAFTVAYNGAGTATMEIGGASNYGGGTRTFTLKLNGSAIFGPVTLGTVPTDTYFLLSDLIAACQADPDVTADWVFTADADIDLRAAQFLAFVSPTTGSSSGAQTKTLSATPAQAITWIDIHSGGWNVAAAMQNAILRNNVVLNIDTGEFIPVLLDQSGSAYDVYIADSAYCGSPLPIRLKIACPFSHFMMENVYTESGIRFQETGLPGGPFTWSADPYSHFKQCVVTTITKDGDGILPTYPARVDNYTQSTFTAGTADSGNFTGGTTTGQVTNSTTGDMRPADRLLTNLKARLDPLDGRNNARAATDAIGPWAAGYSAPSYYDFTEAPRTADATTATADSTTITADRA